MTVYKGTSSIGGVITDTESGGFTAVASTGSVDRDGEIVAPGAFNPLPKSVPVHADHVASVDRVVASARPYYEGKRLMIDVRFGSGPLAQEMRGKVKDGIVDSVSVAFLPAKGAWKTIDGVRTCTAAELLSVDLVTIPSNRDARILASRSFRGGRYTTADARTEALLALAEVEIAEAKAVLAGLTHRHGQPYNSTADVRTFLRSL